MSAQTNETGGVLAVMDFTVTELVDARMGAVADSLAEARAAVAGLYAERDMLRKANISYSEQVANLIGRSGLAEQRLAELIEAVLRLEARGFFAASTCADAATNQEMAEMRDALARAQGGSQKKSIPHPHKEVQMANPDLKSFRVVAPIVIVVQALDEDLARITAALELGVDELPIGTVVEEVDQ